MRHSRRTGQGCGDDGGSSRNPAVLHTTITEGGVVHVEARSFWPFTCSAYRTFFRLATPHCGQDVSYGACSCPFTRQEVADFQPASHEGCDLLHTDGVVEAIDDVSGAVEENVHDEEDLLEELARVRRDRVAGVPLQEALGRAGRPRALVLMGGIVDHLTLASARLRHALVTALVGEGESVTSIATHFEVTHQRISSILRRGRD